MRALRSPSRQERHDKLNLLRCGPDEFAVTCVPLSGGFENALSKMRLYGRSRRLDWDFGHGLVEHASHKLSEFRAERWHRIFSLVGSPRHRPHESYPAYIAA